MPKNQTSFKPGNNANPNGRPKAPWTMKGLYIQALEEEKENGTPRKLTVARKLVELAEQGDVVAIKEINNRIDGQSPQYVEQDTSVRIFSDLPDDKLNEYIKQKSREAGVDTATGGEEASN
jgi:hypothetical protein